MSLIDSHCHLYYEPFINNIPKLIEECKNNNIEYMLTIGVDIKTSLINIDLAKKFKEIYCSIGIHPNNVFKSKIESIDELKNFYNKTKKIIAIGEIGLDYYRNTNKFAQTNFFEQQIELASKLKLPIIVHTRDAEIETLNIINKYKEQNKFLIHCFSGNLEFAKKLLDLGCYISLSGIVTFKNAHDLHDVAKYVPNEKLLIETDSPYLCPEPNRGKINSPIYVSLVAKKIAELKKIHINEVENFTSSNFKFFFNIK